MRHPLVILVGAVAVIFVLLVGFLFQTGYYGAGR